MAGQLRASRKRCHKAVQLHARMTSNVAESGMWRAVQARLILTASSIWLTSEFHFILEQSDLDHFYYEISTDVSRFFDRYHSSLEPFEENRVL